MKKIWIIIGSIILLILLLAGAWWYLLMNGRPESLSGIPNPFGSFGDSQEFTPTPSTNNTDEETSLPTNLRKISTTPVAGAGFFTSNNQDLVRYVERGTGHVFEVNPQNGSNTRILNTTLPRTTQALWSPDGSRVVITTEPSPTERRIFVNTLQSTGDGSYSVTSIELPNTAKNITFTDNDILHYTVYTQNGSIGYSHNLETSSRTELFTSPLRDIVVLWEPEILSYTTPTAQSTGYAYRGSSFERILGGPRGLMLTQSLSSYVTTYLQNSSLVSYGPTPSSTPLAISIIPQKCHADISDEKTLWCGAPIAAPVGQYPDIWYQGVTSFDDSIWKVDVTDGSATLLSIPSEDVGEIIDVIDMQVNASSTMLIFTNKRDGLLWLQELPQNTVPDDAPAQNVEQTNEEE